MTLWVVMYGQSNMEQMSTVAASPPAASAGTTYYSGGIVAVPAANGVRELLNGIKAQTGQDCGALNGSVAGVQLSALVKGQTNYTALMAQISGMGSAPGAIVFHQGEGDANADTSSATWINLLTQFHSDIASDLGLTTSQIPMFIAGLATHTSAVWGKERWARQQKSIQDAAGGNIYFSHSNSNAVLTDGLHWDGASYGRAGKQYARSIATVLGSTSGIPAWFITGAAYVSPTQTDVTIAHSLGTDFTPTSAISGFEVNSGGVWITAVGARQNATTVRLTHVAATASRQVRYQYGELADVTAPILDNSSLTVPLTVLKFPIAVDGQPIPVFIDRITAAASGSGATATLTTEATFSTHRIFCFLAVSAGQTLSSATIGGIAATVHHSSNASSLTLACISAVVPLGTTLTVALTFAGSIFNSVNIFAWQVDDTVLSSGTPTDIQVSRTTTALSTGLSLTNSAGGFDLALAVSSNVASNSGGLVSSDTNWSNRIDVAGNGFQHVAADSSGLGGYTSRPLAVSFPQSGTVGLLAASWAPATAVNQLRGRLR